LIFWPRRNATTAEQPEISSGAFDDDRCHIDARQSRQPRTTFRSFVAKQAAAGAMETGRGQRSLTSFEL
jgi:hypothetical protein